MRLVALAPRTRMTIADIGCCGDGTCAQRMREMGFDEGVEVEVLHNAPFGGDPIAVRVGGATVAIRRAQAALIELQPLPIAA